MVKLPCGPPDALTIQFPLWENAVKTTKVIQILVNYTFNLKYKNDLILDLG
jgi:hypothetical protein